MWSGETVLGAFVWSLLLLGLLAWRAGNFLLPMFQSFLCSPWKPRLGFPFAFLSTSCHSKLVRLDSLFTTSCQPLIRLQGVFPAKLFHSPLFFFSAFYSPEHRPSLLPPLFVFFFCVGHIHHCLRASLVSCHHSEPHSYTSSISVELESLASNHTHLEPARLGSTRLCSATHGNHLKLLDFIPSLVSLTLSPLFHSTFS